MIKLSNILNEIFDTSADLVSNPKYDEKTFEDVLQDFKTDGGSVLGNGSSGMVLEHPSWKYVLKIFSNDSPYLQFVRFVLKNPKSSFPTFYDKPRKIIPRFKRGVSKQFIYIVKMEKLMPITKEQFMDIEFYLYYGNSDFNTKTDNYVWRETKKKIDELNKRHPSLKNFINDYHLLLQANIEGSLDIREANIMKRNDGTYVLSDPFWKGTTPYEQARELERRETDYYSDLPPEPQLKGGQKYKKLKLAPPKYYKDNSVDDSPF